jgi:yapsin 1/2
VSLLDDGITYQIDGEDVCVFGILSSEDNDANAIILRDTFLRSAFVVYDLDNYVVTMANTNFEPGVSDIVEYQIG